MLQRRVDADDIVVSESDEKRRLHHAAPLDARARLPTKFVAGEWDNESDENVIESVALTYDFFELVQ